MSATTGCEARHRARPAIRGAVLAMAAVLTAPVHAQPAEHEAQAAACSLGAVILAEPPPTGTRRTDVSVYEAAQDHPAPTFPPDPSLPKGLSRALDKAAPSNLFKTCPQLADQMPANTRIATAGEVERSTNFSATDPLTIFWVGAPVFDRGRTHAVVAQGYRCPGLCAGEFRSVFALDHGHWVRQGEPRLLAVS